MSHVKIPKKKKKVGIPRALYFYKYGPLWKAYLENLNCEVVFSTATTTNIVENGSKIANSELCVPMKIYFGHIKALLDEYSDLDYLFIPRYISNHKEQYFCPKFLILPEAVKYGMKLPIPILTLEVNAKKMKGIDGAIKMGKELGVSQEKSGEAWYFAMQKFQKFQSQARKGDYIELLNQLDSNPGHKQTEKHFRNRMSDEMKGKFPLNIVILGHPYNVYEAYINIDLIARLKAMDCHIMTIEKHPKEIFKKPVTINKQYHQYWQSEDEILKTARFYLTEGRDQVDGVIFLISFACGPDSLIQELVMRDMKRREIPYLELILDEHSGESGLTTRIESFVDMIRREKYK